MTSPGQWTIRAHDEGEGVPAGRERVTISLTSRRRLSMSNVKKFCIIVARLGVADDGQLRVAQDELADGRGVVRPICCTMR